MTVDHLIMNGELGNTEIFDLSEYPFTIKNQSQFKKENSRQIFGVKNSVNKSLITFEFKSYNDWCPLFKDKISSIADVKINSTFFIYVQEQFLRLLNYFVTEFLGVLSKPNNLKKKKKKEEKDNKSNTHKNINENKNKENTLFNSNINKNPEMVDILNNEQKLYLAALDINYFMYFSVTVC